MNINAAKGLQDVMKSNLEARRHHQDARRRRRRVRARRLARDPGRVRRVELGKRSTSPGSPRASDPSLGAISRLPLARRLKKDRRGRSSVDLFARRPRAPPDPTRPIPTHPLRPPPSTPKPSAEIKRRGTLVFPRDRARVPPPPTPRDRTIDRRAPLRALSPPRADRQPSTAARIFSPPPAALPPLFLHRSPSPHPPRFPGRQRAPQGDADPEPHRGDDRAHRRRAGRHHRRRHVSNTVLIIGELLKQAERYLQEGLHPRVLVEGFDAAKRAAIEFLETYKVPCADVSAPGGPDKELLTCVNEDGAALQAPRRPRGRAHRHRHRRGVPSREARGADRSAHGRDHAHEA